MGRVAAVVVSTISFGGPPARPTMLSRAEWAKAFLEHSPLCCALPRAAGGRCDGGQLLGLNVVIVSGERSDDDFADRRVSCIFDDPAHVRPANPIGPPKRGAGQSRGG